jgi:hypothetical protein
MNVATLRLADMLREPGQIIGELLPLGLVERCGPGLLVLQQARDQVVIDASAFGRRAQVTRRRSVGWRWRSM